MNNFKKQTEMKKKEGITVSRDVFRRKPKNQVTQPEIVPKMIVNQNEITMTRNKIISDILESNPNQKVIFQKNKPKQTINDETILIPMGHDLQPTMERTSVSKYLVNFKGCTHSDVHLYSSFSVDNLINKSIKFIKPQCYGVDYPIVSKFNLIYCKKCVPDDDELIKKSESKGMLKFVSSEATRDSYSHVDVPNHVPMDRLIFADGDDTWVNLSVAKDAHYSIIELKDHIITTVPRKNYIQVFALPPPFEEMCVKFDDFGPVVFISTCMGYDDGGFVIAMDVESEDDSERDEVEVVVEKFVNKNIPKIVSCDSHSLPSFLDNPPEILNKPEVTIEPVQKIVKLIMPMSTVNDFKNNKLYFSNLGYQSHLAKYDNEISVNIVLPITSLDKSKILNTIKEDGYMVKDIKDIVVCINDELVTRWSFIITEQLPDVNVSSVAVSSTYVDDYIAETLDNAADDVIVPVVTMLEKAYLQQLNNKEPLDINFDYRILNNCNNICLRDLRAYFKSNFAYHYSSESHSDHDHRDVSYLLMYLKYCSIIPIKNIKPSADGILISLQ